jgi:hypothetical protein
MICLLGKEMGVTAEGFYFKKKREGIKSLPKKQSLIADSRIQSAFPVEVRTANDNQKSD